MLELSREKDFGYEVIEKDISIHEIIAAYNEGRMNEMFAIGCENGITSVRRLVYGNTGIQVYMPKTELADYWRNEFNIIKDGDANHKWITEL